MKPDRTRIELPPHPATVVQPKRSFERVAERPPHPATVVQPKRSFGGPQNGPPRPPHVATAAVQRTPTFAVDPSCVQRMELEKDQSEIIKEQRVELEEQQAKWKRFWKALFEVLRGKEGVIESTGNETGLGWVLAWLAQAIQADVAYGAYGKAQQSMGDVNLGLVTATAIATSKIGQSFLVIGFSCNPKYEQEVGGAIKDKEGPLLKLCIDALGLSMCILFDGDLSYDGRASVRAARRASEVPPDIVDESPHRSWVIPHGVLAQRKPRPLTRSEGSRPPKVRPDPLRLARAKLSQPPPRMMRFSSAQLFSGYEQSLLEVHSATLPAISWRPSGVAPFGKLPVGAVLAQPSAVSNMKSIPGINWVQSLSHALSLVVSGAAEPHGYFLPAAPRAAYSHSSSVGRRAPCALQ